MAYQQLFEVDMDVLINEVCTRPVLWDKSLEDYRSRTANAEAWKEVCLALMPDLQTEPKERQKYCRFIMKKWVNVKDSWLRYNRKTNGNQKNVSGTKYSRKYVYNDALQFLKKNYSYFGEQDTSTSFPVEKPSQKTAINEATVREYNPFTEQVKTSNTEPKKRRKKRNAEQLRLSEDRHLSFFRGILPSLIHLSEDEVLQFQLGVMGVLKGIKDAKKNPTMSYHHHQHSAIPSLMWNAPTPIPPSILGYQGNYIPQYHDVLSSLTSKENSSASHHNVHYSSNSGSAMQNTTHVANTSWSGLDEDQIDLESTESSFIEESISSDSSSTVLVKVEKSEKNPQEK